MIPVAFLKVCGYSNLGFICCLGGDWGLIYHVSLETFSFEWAIRLFFYNCRCQVAVLVDLHLKERVCRVTI